MMNMNLYMESVKLSNSSHIIVALILHVQMWMSLILPQIVFVVLLSMSSIMCLAILYDDNLVELLRIFFRKTCVTSEYLLSRFLQLISLIFIVVSSMIMITIIDGGGSISDAVIMFQILLIGCISFLSLYSACLITSINIIGSIPANQNICPDVYINNNNYALLPKESKCYIYDDTQSIMEMVTLLHHIKINLLPGTKFTLNNSTYHVGNVSENSHNIVNKVLIPRDIKFKSNLSTEKFDVNLKMDDFFVLDKNTTIKLFKGFVLPEGIRLLRGLNLSLSTQKASAF